MIGDQNAGHEVPVGGVQVSGLEGEVVVVLVALEAVVEALGDVVDEVDETWTEARIWLETFEDMDELGLLTVVDDETWPPSQLVITSMSPK